MRSRPSIRTMKSKLARKLLPAAATVSNLCKCSSRLRKKKQDRWSSKNLKKRTPQIKKVWEVPPKTTKFNRMATKLVLTKLSRGWICIRTRAWVMRKIRKWKMSHLKSVVALAAKTRCWALSGKIVMMKIEIMELSARVIMTLHLQSNSKSSPSVSQLPLRKITTAKTREMITIKTCPYRRHTRRVFARTLNCLTKARWTSTSSWRTSNNLNFFKQQKIQTKTKANKTWSLWCQKSKGTIMWLSSKAIKWLKSKKFQTQIWSNSIITLAFWKTLCTKIRLR